MIEAAIERDERNQKLLIKQAWEMAALSRAKRLPKLSALWAAAAKPKKLSAAELQERRAEFKSMTKNLDLNAINQRKNNG